MFVGVLVHIKQVWLKQFEFGLILIIIKIGGFSQNG